MEQRKQYNAHTMTIEQIKARSIIYMFVLALISIFELILIIRGFIVFDFERKTHVAYLILYFILLALSLATFSLLLINQKKKNLYDILVIALNTYCALLIAWATALSVIDVLRGHSVLVYLTIIVFVAALTPMIPAIFCILTSISTVGLIITIFTRGEQIFRTDGTIINVSVFAIFSIILSYTHYHLELEAYKSKKELEEFSYYDQLTGAYNRRSLKNYTESLSKEAVFYFGIIDVDNFKEVNDTFGHDIGDKCLIDLAEILKETFGKHIFRYGGDEFSIICEHRKNDIIKDFNKVNEYMKNKYSDLDFHISAGFYQPISSEEQYFEYFKKADQALYIAKNTGKKKLVFFGDVSKEK